jgi:hypothetical protein
LMEAMALAFDGAANSEAFRTANTVRLLFGAGCNGPPASQLASSAAEAERMRRTNLCARMNVSNENRFGYGDVQLPATHVKSCGALNPLMKPPPLCALYLNRKPMVRGI